MRVSMRRFLWLACLGLVLLIVVPTVSQAQGRGRGQGADIGKKCEKFVNCHDARDGRRDGRDSRRDGFRDSVFVQRNHQRRWNDSDDNRFARGQRFHRRWDNREDRFRHRGFTRDRWHRQ